MVANVRRSMPSKETSQVLYFFSTTLHNSKIISSKRLRIRSLKRSFRVDSGRENRSESPYLCKRVQVRENDKIQRTELVLKPSVYDQLDICNRQIFEAPQMGKIRIPQCWTFSAYFHDVFQRKLPVLVENSEFSVGSVGWKHRLQTIFPTTEIFKTLL